MSRVGVFSKSAIVQKVIEPEPLIGWRQVNTRWKAVDALYLFVLDFQSDFRRNSKRFEFTNCCSESRPIWRRYWIFWFGGDVARLSVAIHYGASKSDAPTCNLVTTIEYSLWWFLDGITFLSKDLNQIAVLVDFSSLLNPVWESSTLFDVTSSLRKTVVSLPRNLSGHPLVRNLAI
jgi:hypothetical protein